MFWAESELPAARGRDGGDRTLADDTARRLDEPEAGRDLAWRLARLPAAHPSARPDADASGLGRSADDWRADHWRTDAWRTAGWTDRQPGGDQASEDEWWRGESDIWWRAADGSADEADYDVGGLADPSELAEADDVTDADDPGKAGDPDDASADPDESDGQGGGAGARPALTARRSPRPAGPDHGQGTGHRGETGGLRAGAEHGTYQPWFSPDAAGDPWFVTGPEELAGS